jgi:hypothetical protein
MNNNGGQKRIWFWRLRVTVDENWHPSSTDWAIPALLLLLQLLLLLLVI